MLDRKYIVKESEYARKQETDEEVQKKVEKDLEDDSAITLGKLNCNVFPVELLQRAKGKASEVPLRNA